MNVPAVIDVEELLVPIAGDNPSGRHLAYETTIYDQIREARRSEEEAPQGAWERPPKVAEWDRVIELGTECLRRQTKDLQIAAWVAEALAKLHGFGGLRDGFRLLSGIQDRFWETYYPQVDDGDLESRSGPFLFLNGTLPLVIRQVPLTAGLDSQRYSFLHWQESRATQNAGLKDQKLMQAMVDGGKITPKHWDDAVAQTPRRFYEGLAESLQQAWEAFKEFDAGTDQHFGRDAPSLSNIRKALEECRKHLEPILAAKREQEPDPELDGPPADEGADDAGTARTDADADGPGRRIALVPGLEQHALDFGRVLIEFRDKAQELAEAGNRLTENRQKYAESQAEMKKLDEEYEEVSRLVSRNREYYQLLARILELHGRAPVSALPRDGSS
jgi:type VI secretion system protein ImpA